MEGEYALTMDSARVSGSLGERLDEHGDRAAICHRVVKSETEHQAARSEKGRLQGDGRDPVLGLPGNRGDAEVLNLPMRNRHVHVA